MGWELGFKNGFRDGNPLGKLDDCFEGILDGCDEGSSDGRSNGCMLGNDNG